MGREMMYELFYSTGGHGGPYQTYIGVLKAAKRLLRHDETITISEYSKTAVGGYEPVARVRYEYGARVSVCGDTDDVNYWSEYE